MIDFNLIPAKVVHAAKEAAVITQKIENDLNLGIIKNVAHYIPEGEAARESLISLCDLAIKGCNALQALADSNGVKGRLKRLMDDITHIKTDKNHSLTHIIVWCEVVFHHLVTNKD